MPKAKLRMSEGYKLCKLMGNERCSCEERRERPCEALVMHLRAADGDAEKAAENYRWHQSVRAEQ